VDLRHGSNPDQLARATVGAAGAPVRLIAGAEAAEWMRYESMVNLSFASAPATIICPYATTAPDGVLPHARQTHPEVAESGAGTASLAYREPEDFLVTSP